MDQFMDDDDSGEEIEIGSDQEFPTDELFPYGEPFAHNPMSSDESNHAYAPGDIPELATTEPTDRYNFTAEQQKLIEDFNSDFSNKLLASAGTGDLLALLHKHWQTYVPICFNVSDNPLKNLIETDTHRILLQPLSSFICNSQDSDKVLAELNQLEDPPQLCGKVFKAGEPSYFCRDCGSDPTCVLCSNCFRRSKHREHKYKMMTSGGGGYCDCGDPEAWLQHPNCDLHPLKDTRKQQDAANVSVNDYENKLPQDLVDRATQLFGFILDYIFEMLSIEKDDQLPGHLKTEPCGDDYVTMLYNDEVHSYEDVTGTLRKVLIIDDKKSLEYAAVVDKEGRSAIKRGKKTECQAVKEKVEKKMAGPLKEPLDTKVLHHQLVSHQYFAEKLIVWLQKICDTSKGLKHILCKLGMYVREDGHCLIEKFMLADTTFWKSARQIMHQFYISIYFMDPCWKKEFAVLYTKNYKNIWRNYVKNPDDAVSLTDLAVQMFTVISLSKYLMENYGLMQMVMDALIEHSKTSKGKLSFPRSRTKSSPEFKRAQLILYDLKYCLTAVPAEWTDNLRKNFILGFKSFIDFLKFMHGMDSLVRQTQQHIEYEPEWETSFNLLIKLQRPVSALIDWCSSDRIVYIECYKYLLMTIGQIEIDDPQFKYVYDKRKINDKNYEIIDCAVIKQEISIHAPLTRLFAALYSRIGKFSLDFNTFFDSQQEASSIGFSLTKHNIDKEKMISLLEPSIRSLVLVSQSTAGLWKRNGFSLLSQVYFYSNIKCRRDMFDRDILCLQMGASIMEPNNFLINLLTHYNLLEFFTDVELDLQACGNLPAELKKVEYLLPIAEDFLELLIHIISERYEPELSQIEPVNKIERDVIQQLCISSMPHSDLVKNIYSDIEKSMTEQELNSVLGRIAVFKNPRPNSNEKGVYELKEDQRASYSPYYYHYVKSEKTKSEEEQLALCKQANEKFFKPSELPALRDTFANIDKLLESDMFIQIVFCVLRRAISKFNLHSDGQLAKILHLIGLALHIEKHDININSTLIPKAYSFNFLEKSVQNGHGEHTLISLVSKVIETTSTEQYKLLSMWILDYAQQLKQSKFESKSQVSEGVQETSTARSSISPDGGIQKDKRKANAEKRRAKILAQLNRQQKTFIQNNKVFFDETKTQSSSMSESTISSMEVADQEEVVCLGPNQSTIKPDEIQKKSYQCILCQEEEVIMFNKKPMVLCCYVQHSKVLSRKRSDNIERIDGHNSLYMKNTLEYGINTSSCGHVMCAPCWQKYVDTFRLAENRRHARYLSYNVKDEFLCPLCDTVGNCVMPLFPDFREMHTNSTNKSECSLAYDDWLDGLKKTLDKSLEVEVASQMDKKDLFSINPCSLSTITKLMADAVAYNFKSLFEFDAFTHLGGAGMNETPMVQPNQLSNEAVTIMNLFNRIVMFKLFNVKYEPFFSNGPDTDDNKPLNIMVNCAYTIQCIEQVLSVESKCLFDEFTLKQSNLLSNIVKESALSNIYPSSNNETLSQVAVRKICVRLLAAILPYKTTLEHTKSIVEMDIFHFLVYLSLSMPNLYQETPNISSLANWQLNYFNIFKLCFQAHCVQILLIKFANKKILTDTQPKPESDSDSVEVLQFYQYLVSWFLAIKPDVFTGEEKSQLEALSSQVVVNVLRKSLMPFLRNSALFFSNLTDLVPAVKITSNLDDYNENFTHITKFLGLSSDLSDILNINAKSLKTLCDFWLSNVTAEKLSTVTIDYPMPANKLIELPNDYIDLISMSMSSNVCQSKSSSCLMDTSESAIPTYICLICGEKLCGQTFCCLQEIGTKRVGSCTAHAYKCGINTGMFLRVAECQVLLLHLNPVSENLAVRGCFLPAPYVDDYGETDQYLKRGNPLKLCPSRYQKLYNYWLTHSIPDVISRRYQSDSGIFHTDWVQL